MTPARLIALTSLLLCPLLALANPPAGQPTDWAPLFKSWENACDESKTLQTFFNRLFAEVPRSDEVALGRAVLPAPYRQRLGQPRIQNKGDHSLVTVPVADSTYHGLPLVAIAAYRGHSNGIGGRHLLLNVPLARAQAALKSVPYRRQYDDVVERDFGVDLIASDEQPGQTLVLCDFSN